MKNTNTNPLTVSAETVTNPLTVSAETVKALSIYLISSVENTGIPVKMYLDETPNPLTNIPTFTTHIISSNAAYGSENDLKNRLDFINTALQAAQKHAKTHDYTITFKMFGNSCFEFIAETKTEILGFCWIDWTF